MNELEILKAENEKLKATIAAKADLISLSAHQLRTSLSALKWILKMFLNRDLGAINSEQEDFGKKAYDSNERMIILVNQLLTLNHTGETLDASLSIKNIDILVLIEQVLFEFSGETFNKGIEFTFEKPKGGMPMIPCDENLIRIVLENLVDNAIKYSFPHGKITLSVKQKSETNEVEISIKDSGIGITPDNQQKVFGKFFRGTNAVIKESTGSGLGLYTTKSIIDRHKGKIWFESAGAGGTTFYIVLPLS